MQIIKEWGAGLITISVVAAVIMLLTPKGSSEKHVKTAVSIVLLVTMIRPIVSSKFSDEAVFDPVSFSESADSLSARKADLSEMFAKGLDDRITDTLKKHSLSVDRVKSCVSVNENYEVYVNEVVVYLKEEYYDDKETVLMIIKDEYGIIARTEVSG